MWVADMDFKTPPQIINALQERLEHGIFGYSMPTNKVYQSVINYLLKKYNWEVKKEWIIFLPGLVSALYAITRIFAKQDEDILTFLPIYPPFLKAPNFNKRELKKIPLKQKNGKYMVDFDMLENAIDNKTSLLLFCNPQNPTGKVFEKEELERISDLCCKNNILICSDEIHSELILDKGKKHIPIATISYEMANNSITLMAPGKTYNIAGLNAAFVIIPNLNIKERFIKGVGESIPIVNTLAYTALTEAYNLSDEWRNNLLNYLRENREILKNFIKNNPILKYIPGEATYLAWIDCRMMKLKNPAKYFEKYGVGLNNGGDFGVNGFVRLNFGCPKSQLSVALQRMQAALDNLR